MTGPLPELIQFAGRFSGEVDRRGDLGFHQGTVLAWDSDTNTNTILVGAGEVHDIPTMSTGDNILMGVGDHVALLRFKSTFFVLGRITPPGESYSFGMEAAEVSTLQSTGSATYTDLATVGPAVTVRIGSSRRARVIVSATVQCATGERGVFNIAVSGDSTIAPPGAGFGAQLYNGNTDALTVLQGTVARQYIVDASKGLNEGINTFTMKYAAPSGGSPDFSERVISVEPF